MTLLPVEIKRGWLLLTISNLIEPLKQIQQCTARWHILVTCLQFDLDCKRVVSEGLAVCAVHWLVHAEACDYSIFSKWLLDGDSPLCSHVPLTSGALHSNSEDSWVTVLMHHTGSWPDKRQSFTDAEQTLHIFELILCWCMIYMLAFSQLQNDTLCFLLLFMGLIQLKVLLLNSTLSLFMMFHCVPIFVCSA